MAGVKQLLRCIGEAICANGMKALAGLIPLGSVLYDTAENTCQRLREAQQEDHLQSLIANLATAEPALITAESEAIVADIAGDQPAPVRERLTAYLQQVPAALRQSLRRPADPSGRSVPACFTWNRPEDLLQLLPARLPQFQIGDRPHGLGDWELTELLGIGGFGEVWKARHVYFDGIAPVALKFCLDTTARDTRLKREASVLNQVMRQGRHPGIVPLLDAWLSVDPPCLKYEYIEGGDLGGLLRDWPVANEPRWQTATRIMAELAHILAFAHSLTPPIVHRDLKPANVLVRLTPEGKRQLLVTDFGIGAVAAAKALNEATQHGQTRGEMIGTTLRGAHTPLYASPQQVRGQAPDPRDDVHALGVIWYRLLIGDLQSGAPTGLWTDDLQEQGVPIELIRLLGSCVAARADKRPGDAQILAEALDKSLTPATIKPTKTAPVTPVSALASPEDRLARFPETGRPGPMSWLLDLTNKRIGDHGARALAESIQLANLSVLILSGCDIGDEGIAALAASPHIMNLTRLDLWDNRISDEGVKLLAGSSRLINLKQLDLGRNRIGDEGIKALADSVHFSHLEELLVVSNHIGDEGALAIARSPYLANLSWLKPLENRISAVGADALRKTFGRRVRIM